MRKITGYIVVLTSAVLLSSCVKNDIKMTDEQVSRAAEYTAGVLLKYDKNYESTLIDEMITAEETQKPITTNDSQDLEGEQTENKAETGKEPENGKLQEEQVKKAELSDIFDVKECKIDFSKYKILDSYKQGESIYIKSDKGKKLLILQFKIKNNSNSDKRINLLKKNVSYALVVDDESEYQPDLSILVNDLQFYNESIQKGKSKKAVLVFNISKKETNSIMKLRVMRGEQTLEVKIKK